MHALAAALNRFESFSAGSVRSAGNFSVKGEFAAIFGRSLAGGSAHDMLSRLQERFPDAKIRERDVPPGLEESKKAAGDDGDTTSDKVNLTSPLLEEMGLNAGLAGKIEDILAGLFSGDKASQPGSYVQRSVSITITTVRYTELQRSDEDGGILAAGELQTALREKIDEMLAELSGALEKISGKTEKESSSGKTAPSDKSHEASSRGQLNGTSVGMWSLELFYSTASFQTQSGAGGASWGEAAWAGGGASFGGLTGGGLPAFLSQMLGGGADADAGGGVSGFLDRALAGTGVSFSGYRRVEEGFAFKFSQSRNLIEELMELYGERLGGGQERATGGDGREEGGVNEAGAAENAAREETEEAGVAV